MPSPLIALLGGDRRQIACARALTEAGYRVVLRGIDPNTEDTAQLAHCAAVVLPLPWGAGDLIRAPLWGGSLSLSHELATFPKTCHVFAGRVDDHLRHAAGGRPIHDYEQHEPLSILGAIATAEGALSIAMQCLPCTLWQTPVAVLGFGRIGKLLAHRLRGLGAEVTIFARKEADRTWATAYGYRACATTELDPLSQMRVIFNTAPALLLHADAVERLSPDTLYLELASASGIDLVAAHAHGIRIEPAPGLPGKHVPESAGRALAQTLLTLFAQEGILP